MMRTTAGLFSALLFAAPAAADLVALRVGRAETIANGAIENAVILIEGTKIVAIGEDLPVERGIPIVERPDWVVTPGLVNCFSRLGLDSRAGGGFEPQAKASDELYARQDVWREALEDGVTTIGLYPPGTGIPGRAIAIKPHGDTAAEMILSDGSYLLIYMQTNSQAKKQLAEAFDKVDKHEEKVAKEKEKWEKELEKQKKSKAKKEEPKKDDPKKDDAKDEAKKEEEAPAEEQAPAKVSSVFVPPAPDPKVEPFIALRAKTLKALFSIEKASDYLHTLDALGNEEILYSLHVPLRNDIDLFEIADQLGKAGITVVLEPEITLQPSSRRERNLPAELASLGVKIALTPRVDRFTRTDDLEHWMGHIGELVAKGLDRAVALASVTLEPARVLGLEQRLGSLEVGKDANLVFWGGDPLQPGTRLQAVMLEGAFVHGEEKIP